MDVIALWQNPPGFMKCLQEWPMGMIKPGPSTLCLKKTSHFKIVHIFATYWPIFKILSLAHSADISVVINTSHRTLTVSVHYHV